MCNKSVSCLSWSKSYLVNKGISCVTDGKNKCVIWRTIVLSISVEDKASKLFAICCKSSVLYFLESFKFSLSFLIKKFNAFWASSEVNLSLAVSAASNAVCLFCNSFLALVNFVWASSTVWFVFAWSLLALLSAVVFSVTTCAASVTAFCSDAVPPLVAEFVTAWSAATLTALAWSNAVWASLTAWVWVTAVSASFNASWALVIRLSLSYFFNTACCCSVKFFIRISVCYFFYNWSGEIFIFFPIFNTKQLF